tara:strand:+ start:52 stop:1011 length:960 start_codon:yes stop_codon:yes gene_type:complete
MGLRLSDIGEPLDWASTGMVFKHKHEDKIIKIMPRVPSEQPVRYIKRKLDDADWMMQYGWTYLASDSSTKFFKRVMKYKTSSPKGWLKSVPNWMPKVSDADSDRIDYHDIVDLIDLQFAKQIGDYHDDELLSIFTANKVSKVAVNYIIMEYLPEKVESLDSGQQLEWQQEINSWLWNNMATLVRDMVGNEENYLRRATGELVFFDPVVTMMPSPKAFKEMNTMNSMAFLELMCGDTSERTIDKSFDDYVYKEYYSDLKPLKIYGQYCVPTGTIDRNSDYLSLEWYRSEEEPSLEDYTLFDLANSNVVGNNWSTNVGRYA